MNTNIGRTFFEQQWTGELILIVSSAQRLFLKDVLEEKHILPNKTELKMDLQVTI